MARSTTARLTGYQSRYRELAERVAEIGFIAAGSITHRQTRCGKANCRCHADPPQLHGPYLTWTRKVDNKTVTRTLDPGQAERLRPLLDNSRCLRELVHDLEALALRHVEQDPTQPNP